MSNPERRGKGRRGEERGEEDRAFYRAAWRSKKALVEKIAGIGDSVVDRGFGKKLNQVLRGASDGGEEYRVRYFLYFSKLEY